MWISGVARRGARSLDDLMRWLYANRDSARRRYGLDDLVEGLKATTGIDGGAFMSRYVGGTEVLPVREYADLGDAALTARCAGDLAAEGRTVPGQPPALEPALAAALGLRR